MPQLSPRGARFAAPLALVAGAAIATGCSTGHHSTAPTVATTAPSTPAVDNAAAQLLAKARTQLDGERSYRFDATEVVQAHTPVTTRLTGAVVRGQGLTYTLTVGATRTQVIRLRDATYVRRVPGRWARLTKASPVADPERTLAAVLAGLARPRASSAAAGTVVTGTLPAAAAKTAGIPVTGTGAQVAVTINTARVVVLLTVRTATAAGARTVPVTLVTRYTDVNRVPPLHRPI